MLGDAITSKKHIIVNQVYQNTSFCMYTQTYLQQEHVNEVPEVVWVEIFFVLVNNLIREPVRKKYGIFWEFFPNVGLPPPPPLFGRPLSKKKFKGLFCVLGPVEHFWFLQKCSLFVNILTYTCGNRGPPPPFKEKLPNNFVFADFFSRFNRPRPEIQLPESDQIDQISPPPYCKTCFSTSE